MHTLTETQASQLFRDPPQRYLDVGNGHVAYRRVGQGPDALFVHGWPVSGATWRRLLPHLAPHVTCHIVDLVGAGDSRYAFNATVSLEHHIHGVRRVIEQLALDDVAVVGHDSGGLVARHAMAGDVRLRSMVLFNTEQPRGLSVFFRLFVAMGAVPRVEHVLAWACMRPRLRRSGLLLGGCFVDKARLDGEFEEFFLAPLEDPDKRWACGELLRSFRWAFVEQLAEVHANIDVPVHMIWGDRDPFFPLDWAEEMVETFPNARLDTIAGGKLFAHEEFPDQAAATMLPTLLRDAQRPTRRSPPACI